VNQKLRIWAMCAMALTYIACSHSLPERANAEEPKQIVEQAVKTELQAAKQDHTKWIFYEIDRTPGRTVNQWVAETSNGALKRVMEVNGQKIGEGAQKSRMQSFIHNTSEQEKQRKDNQHDDAESAKMLKLLPHAFIWTEKGSQGGNTTLHFKPSPNFHASDSESRVFAAMEGDMIVNDAQHRIVSIKGRMIRAVKFFFGLFGGIDAGGTFDVERRNTGDDEWQITETHVHIHGRVLFFKEISEQEDDVKTKFKELPQNITFQQAEKVLMKQPES
jgi:hypothetical protein